MGSRKGNHKGCPYMDLSGRRQVVPLGLSLTEPLLYPSAAESTPTVLMMTWSSIAK